MFSSNEGTPLGRRLLFHLAWLLPFVVAVCAGYGLHSLTVGRTIAGQTFAQLYADKLRPSLFSGFLTTGGFLLALKVFILVRMDAEVYGTKEYKVRFDKAKKRGHTERLYAPLRRLGSHLFLSIMSAFVTSFLQFTLGFWPNDYAAIACVCAATFTMGTLFVCLFAVRSNLAEWFALLDERRNPKPVPEPDPEPDIGAPSST